MSDPTPLSDDALRAIAQRVEAATPGPWKAFDYCVSDNGWTVDRRIGTEWIHGQLKGPQPVVTQFASVAPRNGDKSAWSGVSISERDADLIAHAPSDLERLLAEVHRLRAEHERLTGIIRAAREKAGTLGQIIEGLEVE